MRTHVDLFSGIGGFAIAAHANSVRTVQFCEIDGRCREFLARAWPGVPVHDDVRTLGMGNTTKADGNDARRAEMLEREVPESGKTVVWLLTAGVPCQPASRAGSQRGSEDHRWLWPEALRLLRHYQPTWALFENPAGIGDVGLAGILAEVEGAGYEVRVHSIPACAVGSPQRRERYWIVAHTREAGREGADAEPGAHGLCAEHPAGNLADASQERRDGRAAAPGQAEGGGAQPAADGLCQWSRFVWLPCADGKVRRAPDDSFGLVDGLHRSLLGALGNSIVPQVAEILIRAMVQAEE